MISVKFFESVYEDSDSLYYFCFRIFEGKLKGCFYFNRVFIDFFSRTNKEYEEMNRISELKFKVYHSMPVGGKHRTTERDMTLSKIRETIRLILKTYNMNGYSPITVSVGGGSSSGDYIRIDIEGYIFGTGRVDHHVLSIERPSNIPEEMFFNIEDSLDREFGSMVKKAEMKFKVLVGEWFNDGSSTPLKRNKMSIGGVKDQIRNTFKFDEPIVLEKKSDAIWIENEHRDGNGHTIIIKCPEDMDEGLFQNILKGAGLWEEHDIRSLGRSISKRAEMKFELLVVRSRSGSRRNEMATRKEIENYVRDFNDVKTWSMEGSEWISVEGRNKEDNDLWVLHIKKPDNMEWRTFLMVLGGTGLEVDQFKNRKAEIKFDLTFIYDDGSGAGDMVDVVKGTLKDAKNYIRNNFKGGRNIHIEVEYSSDNVFYSQPDIEEGESSYEMYIGCPKSMKWEVFLKVLEGAGLLNTPKVNSLVKMKRKAELIFRVNYKSLHKHDKGFFAHDTDFLPMKQIIERMRLFYTGLRSLKDGVVDIHVKLRPSKYDLSSDVTYTFSTDSYRATLAIISPDTMSPQVFLKILKGAGIYADNNEYDEKRIVRKRILKKSSIQKSAELKFDTRRETWEVRGGKKHMDTEDKDMTLTEIKDKIREYFKHSYDGTASELEIDSYKRYQLVELYNQKHDECRTKGTVIMIGCPDDMKWETFLMVIRSSGLLDENKVKRMY